MPERTGPSAGGALNGTVCRPVTGRSLLSSPHDDAARTDARGEPYDPLDADLIAARARARDLCQDLNATREGDDGTRRRLLRQLFAAGGDTVWMQPPLHPLDAAQRRRDEYGKPITIGSDVWVGGGAIILPGVTIGSRTVIGAGSVVTRDVPDDVFAAGNPCRIVRRITE